MMRVKKIINNNIVSAYDHNDVEVVIMGRGIGFQKHIGDEIDEIKIEKIFRNQNQTVIEQFEQLMQDIPLEILRICDDIVNYAKHILKVDLNQLVYITLTTHIYFALLRAKEKNSSKNELLYDIKCLYPKEFDIGVFALRIIEQKENILLPEDEAGFIALHIVGAQNNVMVKDITYFPTYIQSMLEIISTQMHFIFNEKSLHYHQFIKYLHFLLERIFDDDMDDANDDFIHQHIIQKYSQEYNCSQHIADYIYSVSSIYMTNEEIDCLTVQLHHIIQNYESNGGKEK